jgi:hypothetical protein
MTLHADTRDITKLAQTLAKAADAPLKAVTAIVAKGALNIKNDARHRVEGLRHAPAYPRSIGYDMRKSASQVTAEIGPDKTKRQGALGNLIEYGSVNNPPRPHILPAVEREMPKFERALEAAAVKALEGR